MDNSNHSIISKPTAEIFDYFETLGWGTTEAEAQHYQQLNQQTRQQFGDLSVMLSGPEIGRMLSLLTGLMNAKTAIEVGTFTGYSAMRIAEGLHSNGKLYTLDVTAEYANIGKNFWQKTGLDKKIEFILGDAKESLQKLTATMTGMVDFAFVDANKKAYDDYYELLLPLCRPQAIICFDNIWWSGKVADPQYKDADTVALRALNQKLAADDRVNVMMLPMRDGLTIAVKK